MRFLYIFFLFLVFAVGCQNGKESLSDNNLKSFLWKASQVQNNDFTIQRDSLLAKIENGEYGYIDEIFIAKADTLIFERKFNLDYADISKNKKGKMGCGINMCEDTTDVHLYNYYHPKYHPYYLNSEFHTLQSITKSITSTLVGSAILEGKLENVDETVLRYFSQYDLDEDVKNHLSNTRIKDLLTMQLGLEWKEMDLSLEMESSVSEMEKSDNWVEYVLNQKVISEPGKVWNYNSGATQLLSKIFLESTNKTIEEYGQSALFDKLDIEKVFWKETPTSLPDTEGGLYMSARDLAKIGLLYLQNGVWNNERLLPVDWVEESLNKHVVDIYEDGGQEGYGYQWWLTGDESPLAVGLGYGNQILVIIPEKDVVGIVYAWNVFDNKAKYIFRDFVDVCLRLE